MVAVGEREETSVTDDGADDDDDDDDDTQPGASADADTTILFTKPTQPSSGNLELPAGNLVEFLVGFNNQGKQDSVLETLEVTFCYPMDFTFYIQNFSTIVYNRVVKPNHEATLAHSFIPAETFAGRPFGLNINLNYRDLAGGVYQEAMHNETVQIVELEEGLDGETFFLPLFLTACMGLQLLFSVGRKRVGKKGSLRLAPRTPTMWILTVLQRRCFTPSKNHRNRVHGRGRQRGQLASTTKRCRLRVVKRLDVQQPTPHKALAGTSVGSYTAIILYLSGRSEMVVPYL